MNLVWAVIQLILFVLVLLLIVPILFVVMLFVNLRNRSKGKQEQDINQIFKDLLKRQTQSKQRKSKTSKKMSTPRDKKNKTPDNVEDAEFTELE